MFYTVQPLPLKCAPLAAAKSAPPAPASAAATSAAPHLARAAAPAAAATASQRHPRGGREHRLDHAPHARRGGGNLDARDGAWQQPHSRDGFRTFNDARGARERGGGRGGYGDRRDGYSAWQHQVRAHMFTSFVRSLFSSCTSKFFLFVHLQQQQQQRQRGGMRNERDRDGQDRGCLPNGRNVDRDRFGRPLERDRFRERGEGQGRDRTFRSSAPNAKTPPPVVTSRPPSYLVAAEAQGDASLDKEDSVAATIAADLLGRSRGSATKGGNLTPTRALLEHQEQQSLANSAAALAPSQFSARSRDALLEGTAGGSGVGGGGGGVAGDAKATATVTAGVAGVDARGVLEGLSRSEVQARAKTHGIKANGKTSALIDAIFAKEQMKASAPASLFSASESTKATKLHQGGAGDAGNEDAAVVTERIDAAKEGTSAVRLPVSIVF